MVPFRIGDYNDPFYAYVIQNLAYDAILGSYFFGHNQGVIDFDNLSLQLLPPSEKSPAYPALNILYSVHAYKTCVLPPNTESVLAATLKCSQVCCTATLVRVTEELTVPFRIINHHNSL